LAAPPNFESLHSPFLSDEGVHLAPRTSFSLFPFVRHQTALDVTSFLPLEWLPPRTKTLGVLRYTLKSKDTRFLILSGPQLLIFVTSSRAACPPFLTAYPYLGDSSRNTDANLLVHCRPKSRIPPPFDRLRFPFSVLERSGVPFLFPLSDFFCPSLHSISSAGQ